MAKTPTNIAASVRQRLLNLARQQGQLFDVILVSYGLERLLYRLSISDHNNRFVLKGGLLVSLWTADKKRVTRDVDFLAQGEASDDHLRAVFTDVMRISTDDGLIFDTDVLTATAIKEDQIYGGTRLKTTAHLEQARIPITVDISVGDALVETAYQIDYPSLLDMPRAQLRAYPPASVIAEKFQAIVALGLANGRMKDYYDLWALSQVLTITSVEVDAAIRATFQRRDTAIPRQAPLGLSDTFAADPQKLQQWAAYAATLERDDLALNTVINMIWSFVGPACHRLTT